MCCLIPIMTSGKQDDKAAPVYAGTPENAVLALALADCKTLPREVQVYTRYLWVTDGDWETLQAASLVLNYVSRATVVRRPYPLGQYAGNPNTPKDAPAPVRMGPCLARVDLRYYAPREKDLEQFARTWEELRFDPRFNLLLTKDTLKFAGNVDLDKAKEKVQKKETRKVKKTRRVLKDVEIYQGEDGKYHNQKYVTEEYEADEEASVRGQDEDVLRVVGEHVDATLLAQLIDLTQSQAPVVGHGYFIARASTTVKGKGVFKTIYGGLYYDFAGIGTKFKEGTDEDNLFEKLGVGNVKQGINAKKVFDDLGSDQRVAKFKSGVTGKPRRVDLLRTLAGRDTQGIVSVTHDLKDDDIDIGTHPIMNLLDFKDAAREVIFEKTNGLHGFALFDGEGVRQDVVPPDVAADTTIPSPYGTQLQPMIGCIRCHAKEGGWRYAPNDVKKLLAGRLDLFGDQSDKKRAAPDTVDRLAGLYAGDLEGRLFPRGRDDYAAGLLRASGPWVKSKDQTDLVSLTGAKLAQEFARYNYTPVTAQRVLLDLGEVIERDPVKQLQRVLPPPALVIDGVVPEDARIGALTVGLEINRADYDLTYSFIARRYQLYRAGKDKERKP